MIKRQCQLPDFKSVSHASLFLLISAFFNAGVTAREPHYGALDNAALLLCEDAFWSGALAEARNCYRGLLTPATPPQVQAEAYWALADLQSANSRFQAAVEAFPEDAMVRVRWGELFMQTYQYQEAFNLFSEALAIDAQNGWAHVGAAMALSQGGNTEQVNAHISTVMDEFFIAPGARLRAMIMVTRATMEQDRYEEAGKSLDEAFELAEEEGLPKMELNAIRAALAFMEREVYQPYIDAALAEGPAYGDAYFIPGYFATIIRRYEEAGEFYKKAVEVQPDHWQAHVYLGQNHLRLNEVNAAIDHVTTSYEGDAFNPMTINLLRLLDTFTENFVTVSYPDPPEGPLPEFTLRLHKDERDVLKSYASKLAADSIDVFSERYGFTPRQPIIIEIFPNHEDFVVRSIGMPGVGILGVTFGYLFAMDSPTGHPEQSYHWGTTLWHEMAHVFTLKVTGNLVPRWFSEGISVYEEWRTGPIPGRKIPTDVLQAMAEGKFLPISELDDGFMRPTYDGQVIVSYMQAGLVFEFIDLEYGFDKIVDMLNMFNDKVSPVKAIETALGISASEFDRHFKQFIDIEYGPLLSRLQIWQADMQSAAHYYQEEQWVDAVEAADRAIFTYPDYVEIDSAYVIKAAALEKLEDEDGRFQALQTFWQKGGYRPQALLDLADGYLARDMLEQAHDVLTDANYADPFREDLHVKLGDLYLVMGQPAQALAEYQVLLALNPLDKASANYRIAKAYHALDNAGMTMEYLMTALDIAPQFRPAQQLLLDLSRTQSEP